MVVIKINNLQELQNSKRDERLVPKYPNEFELNSPDQEADLCEWLLTDLLQPGKVTYGGGSFLSVNGTPQGSLMSPLLFNLTLDEMMLEMASELSGYGFDPFEILDQGILAYADDIAVITET